MSAVTINYQQKRLSLYGSTNSIQEQQRQSFISYLFISACEPSEITNTYINLYQKLSEVSYEVTFTLFIYSKYLKQIKYIYIEDTHLLMDETGATKTCLNLVRMRKT